MEPSASQSLANPGFWGQWFVVSKLRWPNFQLILSLQRLKTAALTQWFSAYILNKFILIFGDMCLDCYSSLQKFQMCFVIYMIPFQSVCLTSTPGSWTDPLIASSCPLQTISPPTDRFIPQTQFPSCQFSTPNSSMVPQRLLSYIYIINSDIHSSP